MSLTMTVVVSLLPTRIPFGDQKTLYESADTKAELEAGMEGIADATINSVTAASLGPDQVTVTIGLTPSAAMLVDNPTPASRSAVVRGLYPGILAAVARSQALGEVVTETP